MTWAQRKYKPEVMVDLATLTGAMIISLGHEYGGMFSNDDGLADALSAAGKASGDKLWRLPMGEAYNKIMDSPIADMKNSASREGGSITAACFLEPLRRGGRQMGASRHCRHGLVGQGRATSTTRARPATASPCSTAIWPTITRADTASRRGRCRRMIQLRTLAGKREGAMKSAVRIALLLASAAGARIRAGSQRRARSSSPRVARARPISIAGRRGGRDRRGCERPAVDRPAPHAPTSRCCRSSSPATRASATAAARRSSRWCAAPSSCAAPLGHRARDRRFLRRAADRRQLPDPGVRQATAGRTASGSSSSSRPGSARARTKPMRRSPGSSNSSARCRRPAGRRCSGRARSPCRSSRPTSIAARSST